VSHSLLGFHVGLPGSVKSDERHGDLDTTLGFNLRADAPIAKYVLLGPMLQFGSWRPSTTSDASHDYYVDLDLVLRLRVPITTTQFNYQLWLGMPIGVSIDVLGDSEPYSSPGLGWNVGALFGGAVHFTRKFGLFAEVGWEQHRLTHTQDDGPDLDLKLQQACLNVGFIVRN
jgi:hypothetical protein